MREVLTQPIDPRVNAAWDEVNRAALAGCVHATATLMHEDYLGDGIIGYLVFDDGTALFPAQVGEHIGWGVDGADDEGDVVERLTPSFETHGLTGKHTHPRPLRFAIAAAIGDVVNHRLFQWLERCREHEYAEEIRNAQA